jgi:hypothetical protein
MAQRAPGAEFKTCALEASVQTCFLVPSGTICSLALTRPPSRAAMDAPSDDEERQERPASRYASHMYAHNDSVSNAFYRPLSSATLEFQGPPLPLQHRYNTPGPLPPPPLGTSYQISTPATEFHAIRPFRRYNYLDARGEDLTSRVYTLGSDNLWEVNANLTSSFRSAALNTPQFTGVYEPAANWNPHQVWREPSGGGYAHQPQPTRDTMMRTEERPEERVHM